MLHMIKNIHHWLRRNVTVVSPVESPINNKQFFIAEQDDPAR